MKFIISIVGSIALAALAIGVVDFLIGSITHEKEMQCARINAKLIWQSDFVGVPYARCRKADGLIINVPRRKRTYQNG